VAKPLPREIELKLLCSPELGEKLLGSPLIRRRAAGPVFVQQLEATYFDTTDHRLAARGVSLRIRREGGRRIQTLKGPSQAGSTATDRVEWEAEVDDGSLDLRAFNDPRAQELTGVDSEFSPIFRSEVQRTSLPVRWHRPGALPSLIDVSLDRGALITDGHSEPVSELELELREGETGAVFALADALRRQGPVRLGRLSKAERGFLLVGGRSAPPARANVLELDPDDLAEDALSKVLRHCLAHALENETAAVQGRDPEGVHQLRVALRRLRSALSLFRDLLPAEGRNRWSGEARWLLSGLGPCRDLDVLLTESLAPVLAAMPGDSSLAAFTGFAQEARARAQESVSRTILSRRAGDFLLGLACWTECAGWRRGATAELRAMQQIPAHDLAHLVLDKGLKRVRKRGRRFAELDPAARHALRIACKKLRYAAEFLGSLYGSRRPREYSRAVAKLQDCLGHMNDLSVGRMQVDRLLAGLARTDPRRVPAALGAGIMLGWQAHITSELEPRALRLWEEFGELDPFWRRA
jgi:inorganic triphosphatase YgiF